MAGMITSFLILIISSYFITSVFTPKQGKYQNCGFLILLCTMFAQIVLGTEILSLFKAINAPNMLITNIVFFFASTFLWIKKGMPLYCPKPQKIIRKIWFALKQDKFMMIMSFGLLFSIGVTFFLCIATPISNYDALSYHLNRAAFWLSQGSLNHFDIADERNLVMPINSEILYLWVLTFLKKDIGLGLFSLIGYFACSYSIYNILGYLNFSERRKIWSVLIMSSFASVIIEASGSETDILIAGIILSSIYLFMVSLKEKNLSLIFFSSLLYALAMGTKSPAIIAFPAVFCLLVYFSYKQNKDEWTKPILAFCSLLFFNFWIFSGYNYILNFIDFHSFLSSEPSRALHEFKGGIKAFVANIIRYIFMLFDFSGFRYSEVVGEQIVNAKLALFDFLRIPHEIGVEISDENIINNKLSEVKMGTGLFGFLLFLPSLICAIALNFWKNIRKKASAKISALSVFAAVFFINIICLSFSIAYFIFSIRFVTTFVLISSPVLALSYSKKNYLLKTIVLFIAMSYFLVMSTHVTSRNAFNVIKIYSEEKSTTAARERIRCALCIGFQGKNSFCNIRDYIKGNLPAGSHIGIIPSHNSRLYILKMLEQENYKISVILPEKIDSYNFGDYDFILKTDNYSVSMYLDGDTKSIMKRLKYNENGFQAESPVKGSKCAYIDYNTKTAININSKNPVIYVAACNTPQKALEEKGFKLIKSFDFYSQREQDANYMELYKRN